MTDSMTDTAAIPRADGETTDQPATEEDAPQLGRLPHRKAITGHDRDVLRARVAEAYRAGRSVQALAVILERSTAFVNNLLDEAEVQRRPPCGAPRLNLDAPARQEWARELGRRYEAGETTKVLAASTGYPSATVRTLLGEAGVSLRPGGNLPVISTGADRAELARELKRRYEQQLLSIRDLTAALPGSYSYAFVRQLLHEAGTAMRTANNRRRATHR